jgi:hypothetical protein
MAGGPLYFPLRMDLRVPHFSRFSRSGKASLSTSHLCFFTLTDRVLNLVGFSPRTSEHDLLEELRYTVCRPCLALTSCQSPPNVQPVRWVTSVRIAHHIFLRSIALPCSFLTCRRQPSPFGGGPQAASALVSSAQPSARVTTNFHSVLGSRSSFPIDAPSCCHPEARLLGRGICCFLPRNSIVFSTFHLTLAESILCGFRIA